MMRADVETVETRLNARAQIRWTCCFHFFVNFVTSEDVRNHIQNFGQGGIHADHCAGQKAKVPSKNLRLHQRKDRDYLNVEAATHRKNKITDVAPTHQTYHRVACLGILNRNYLGQIDCLNVLNLFLKIIKLCLGFIVSVYKMWTGRAS